VRYRLDGVLRETAAGMAWRWFADGNGCRQKALKGRF
jgi:hypothetical protein